MAGLTAATGARRAILLGGTPATDEELSAALRSAGESAEAVAPEHDDRATARAWRAYGAALKAASRLVDWRTAVRAGAPEGTLRSSADLIAREALQTLDPSDPLFAPVINALETILAVSDASQVATAVAPLERVPLPLPLARPAQEPFRRPTWSEPEEQEPVPIAAALFEIGDEPATDVVVVHANQFIDVALELRLTAWPETADTLHATAVSIAGENASFPSFRFSRPVASDADGLWTVRDQGKLVVKAIQPIGADPLTFTLLVELESGADGTRQAVRAVGQRELRIWATGDAPTASFTADGQLDLRVAEILALVTNNPAFGSDTEVKAFIRFLKGLIAATMSMQRRGKYRKVMPDERQFQSDLLELLDQHESLRGRVLEGAEVGGGETDIVHEGINAELKVVKGVAVTGENAAQFVGQSTTYASGLSKQLGVAVILDLSQKQNPLGHPANYIHWLEPRIHGAVHPDYPSHVAVLVVNGNTPLPSDFAGKQVEASDALARDADADASLHEN